MPPPKIFVVIPFYNNAGAIHKIVQGAAKYLPVIAVDDGSTDDPPLMSEAIYLHHDRNRGKGAAIITGVKKAQSMGGTHVITLDGDGQHAPEEIPKFISAAQKKPDAIWIGDRKMEGVNVPKSSIHGRRFSNFWIWFHTRIPVPDALSGFRMYPVDKLLKLNLKRTGFVFEAEALVKWGQSGLAIRWLGIDVLYPPPEERVTHFKLVKDNIRHTLFHASCLPKSIFLRLTGRLEFDWWEEKPKGSYWAFRLSQMIILSIGRDFAYKISNVVVTYYFIFVARARRDIKNFWRRIHPEIKPGFKEIWKSEMAFGEALVDRISRLSGQAEAFSYSVINEENFAAIGDKKNGAIFLSAHVGPWDIGARFAQDRGLKMCMLMNRTEADHAQKFFEYIESERMRIITVDGGAGITDIVNSLNEGWNVAMHGDRIMKGQRGVRVDFLGSLANFPSGPYQVAYVTGSPILPAFTMKTGANKIVVNVFKPIYPKKVDRKGRDKEIERMAREYATSLEIMVRQCPEQWFNFYDFFEDTA